MLISNSKVGETSPANCAVYPVSADANVYLDLTGRDQDAGEAEKAKAALEAALKEQDDIDSFKA